MSPFVALIHATPAAIGPARAAFAESFGEAELWNLLDDRLAADADAAGGLSAPLRKRMLTLIGHAVEHGAQAVQLTCSMYGPVAELAGQLWDVPVRGSDGAMLRELAFSRPGRVGVIGSLASAVADTSHRLGDLLPSTEIVPITATGAAEAAASGDSEALFVALENAARDHGVDVFVLGQYSLTPQWRRLEAAVSTPVLSPPQLAAAELREVLA
ncbi:aspartate/glutamate racemase family protein [Saccharopolyspora sp. ID03-671]|uniref:aspartate/glutamate racemase family protein n=1 Tax=Saccharopolyspora sp. ID03-671 TaxID=3073066 RepID=UPI003251EA55